MSSIRRIAPWDGLVHSALRLCASILIHGDMRNIILVTSGVMARLNISIRSLSQKRRRHGTGISTSTSTATRYDAGNRNEPWRGFRVACSSRAGVLGE